jgi:hypothetical protein
MNRRLFISLLAGAAGAPLVPWRGLIEPLVILPSRRKLVTATGGGPPYAYRWSWQSGAPGLVIDTPDSLVTTFSVIDRAREHHGVAVCTIMDSQGHEQQCRVQVSTKIGRGVRATPSRPPHNLLLTVPCEA